MTSHGSDSGANDESSNGGVRSVRIQLRDGDRIVCEADRASEVMRAHKRVSHGATIDVARGVITWRSDLDNERGAWLYEMEECA